MLDYLKAKSTIYTLISDVIVLSGIIIWHWSSPRIIAFFFLDIEIMIIFFFIYMICIREISDIISVALGLVILSSLLYFYFAMIENLFSNIIEHHNYDASLEHTASLFYPFYDAVLFMICCAVGHLHILKKVLKAGDQGEARIFELKAIAYRMFMIPMIPFFFLATLLLFTPFNVEPVITPIISFILVKNFLEYWKFKALQRLHISADS